MKQFRVISLYNVSYKIITKVLANQLKIVLPSIILDSQSAFVWNRHISNNVLIVYELVHALKSRRSGREGYLAMKLDMSKAYNRIEWAFLEVMMRKIRLREGWINRIRQCVSTVSFSILLNGVLGEIFNP